MKSIRIILVISILIIASCTRNFNPLQKEGNLYNLTTEIQLEDENYIDAIEEFYNNGEADYFTGKDSIQIYYKTFKQDALESPAILISSGRSEGAVKYKELIYDLYNNGFSIYIHDHRGQGLSGRMTEDPHMGYIDTFQFYIDDMKYFYDTVLKTENHKKKYLLSHSMGGTVAMTYLEQNPNDFNAAAFVSPMLGLISKTCNAVKFLVRKEPKYAMGMGKYRLDKIPFEINKLTGSEIRFNRIIDAFAKEPKAKLGGSTYQWVQNSCEQFDYIFENISTIETPFILFSSENESIVSTKAHQQFMEDAHLLNKTCEAFLVENALHELFIEKDEQRIETINQIFKFYSKY
jgi:lysophospholipase